MSNRLNGKKIAGVIFLTVLCIHLTVPNGSGAQTRIKDIAKVKGLGSRMLSGIGIVTGLRGTGDGTQAIFTPQAIANYLRNNNLTIDPNALRTRNVALVNVTAELPPFAKRGMTIDVTVASLGDAQSLEGGILQLSELSDEVSGQSMASAQGPVSIGGLNVQGAGTQNFTASGRVINGAVVLRDVETSFTSNNMLTLYLNDLDFTTAFRVAESINGEFGENTAVAVDPSSVEVKIVPKAGESETEINPVEFIATMEQLTLETDIPAVVVINERTGTVIAGENVMIAPAMIAHGDLTIQIRPPEGAPAPAAGAAPQTGSAIYLDEKSGSTVADLAAALNAMQVTPRDLVSIFQALKSNGSLKATLKFN